MRYIFLALILLFSLANTSDDPIQALVNEGRDSEAFALAQTGADAGDVQAHEWLGWFYDYGRAVEQDIDQAVFHYRIALAGGRNHARWRVGVLIDEGKTDGTLEEAVALFKLAADEGFSNAMVSLAVMNATGRGTPTDYKAALDYYMRAANAGNSHGIQGVGVLLVLGQGVKQNLKEAAAWFLVSATAGNEVGNANFDRVIQGMTPEQIEVIVARAKSIAEEFGIEGEFSYEPNAEEAPSG